MKKEAMIWKIENYVRFSSKLENYFPHLLRAGITGEGQQVIRVNGIVKGVVLHRKKYKIPQIFFRKLKNHETFTWTRQNSPWPRRARGSSRLNLQPSSPSSWSKSRLVLFSSKRSSPLDVSTAACSGRSNSQTTPAASPGPQSSVLVYRQSVSLSSEPWDKNILRSARTS